VTRIVEASGIRLPFALSLLGHAILLALLIFFVTAAPSLPLPQSTAGVAVTFAPSFPEPEAPSPSPPSPPPPKPNPPPVATVEPPPPPLVPPPPLAPAPEIAPLATPALEAPPLPAQKPMLRRPVLRRLARPSPERPEPRQTFAPAAAAPSAAPQAPATQTAAARLPAPPSPSTAISPSYAALLGAWLESHKRYPESARESGEEGRAVLQFAVDRSGRVLDFAVVKSSGYSDIDAAIENMMRGATMPPFPADMPQSSIRVSVAIRFSLAR
jgi:periplasmic protein TonB